MEPRRMMGLDTESDRLVTIPVRHWNALKLAAWRHKTAWDAVEPEARRIVDHCEHAPGCPATTDDEPCNEDCPDRELRLSALVILAAAKQSTAVEAHRPANMPYIAPSREHFSEVLAELAAAQAELAAVRDEIAAIKHKESNDEVHPTA